MDSKHFGGHQAILYYASAPCVLGCPIRVSCCILPRAQQSGMAFAFRAVCAMTAKRKDGPIDRLQPHIGQLWLNKCLAIVNEPFLDGPCVLPAPTSGLRIRLAWL